MTKHWQAVKRSKEIKRLGLENGERKLLFSERQETLALTDTERESSAKEEKDKGKAFIHTFKGMVWGYDECKMSEYFI